MEIFTPRFSSAFVPSVELVDLKGTKIARLVHEVTGRTKSSRSLEKNCARKALPTNHSIRQRPDADFVRVDLQQT